MSLRFRQLLSSSASTFLRRHRFSLRRIGPAGRWPSISRRGPRPLPFVGGHRSVRFFLLHFRGLIEIAGNLLRSVSMLWQDAASQPASGTGRKTEGDGQPDNLRGEALRIEGRKQTFLDSFVRNFRPGSQCLSRLGALIRRRAVSARRLVSRTSFVPTLAGRLWRGPFKGNQPNSARRAMSKEKMPRASVTAKPNTRRPN